MRSPFEVEQFARASVRLALVTLFAAACSDSALTTAVPVETGDSSLKFAVVSVVVNPATVSATVGENRSLSTVVTDVRGNVYNNLAVKWRSSDTTVMRVRNDGVATAVRAGTAKITAQYSGKSGSAQVTVGELPPPPPPAPAAVASVSIAPVSLNLNTGGNASLAATVRDADGNVLQGRQVQWSSNNALVAAVSASGVVSGVVAGNATITATSEGVSGSAPVSVSLLPPPPPPTGGMWPNVPDTYSVVTDQPFNPLSVLNWELIWNNNGYGTITSDASAPTSGSVFQVKYPAGFNAGSAPATQYFPLGGRRNVFVGMWWKANAGWQGHESNVNKLQFLFPTSGGGDMYMTAYGPPGGPFELRVNLQFIGADGRSWLRPNVGSGIVSMGDWHRIEWLVEYNTNGANGIVRWWMDGQLIGDYRDVVFPSGGFEEYKLSPTWGGMGGIAKQQTDYFWFDHVTISSR